ncbi:MAG: hypothetical protein IKZ23_04250, partial [Clostridia bacterium]|nr:hypothetical protein [Clostridia bacterium]
MSYSVITIVGSILALVAAIVLAITVVPAKKREGLNGFGKFLHDVFNFKSLMIKKILQFLYVYATANVIITGVFMLFWV